MKARSRGELSVTYELVELPDRHQLIALRDEWLARLARQSAKSICVVSSDEISGSGAADTDTTNNNILHS